MFGDACAVLRGLVGEVSLPCLRRLSLGYVTTDDPPSQLFEKLSARLATHFPKLETSSVLPFAKEAWLTPLTIPAGLDFHHDGAARIPLASGLWVGSFETELAASPCARRAT